MASDVTVGSRLLEGRRLRDLPEDWCADVERRRQAKIPEHVVFKTKPQLGVDLVERAAGWVDLAFKDLVSEEVMRRQQDRLKKERAVADSLRRCEWPR
jgi:hypothetical protein